VNKAIPFVFERIEDEPLGAAEIGQDQSGRGTAGPGDEARGRYDPVVRLRDSRRRWNPGGYPAQQSLEYVGEPESAVAKQRFRTSREAGQAA